MNVEMLQPWHQKEYRDRSLFTFTKSIPRYKYRLKGYGMVGFGFGTQCHSLDAYALVFFSTQSFAETLNILPLQYLLIFNMKLIINFSEYICKIAKIVEENE